MLRRQKADVLKDLPPKHTLVQQVKLPPMWRQEYNEEAARLSGIPIVSVKLFTYAYSGLAAALGGLVLTGRLNSAQPTAGSGFELDAIAAAVVGGASLSGGRGGVIGSFLGAAIIGVLNNGMNLLNVSAFYQQIVKGAVILGALLIDRLVAARRE